MITIKRHPCPLRPDPCRVLAKSYLPGEEIAPGGESRAVLLMDRILRIPEREVAAILDGVINDFSSRHRNFNQILDRNFELVAHHIPPETPLSLERRRLIGAYFTHEYSIEAAALFNPSMVPAPDQTNLPQGHRRFIMSLRAVGEGHISSIEFRSGTIDIANEVTFDPAGSTVVGGHRPPPASYDKHQFAGKLVELGAGNDITWSVLSRLPECFTLSQLEESLTLLEKTGPPHAITYETGKIIRVLASSQYVTTFPADSMLSERVIFPAGPNETHGMEDARFVRFVEEDGRVKYYATYTAFDGFQIMPQLIETDDFLSFKILTLSGTAAQNKGMALFPRRINGKHVMLSRRDRESLYLATSNDVRYWDDITLLHKSSRPWDLLQIGNCGSPLETDEGWIVLTHGVGPMRRYTLSALLLDLAHPQKVIGYLPEPLMVPNGMEREGYVPNVLYSCGGLINGDTLVLPYGFSDYGINMAFISVPELLEALRTSGDH